MTHRRNLAAWGLGLAVLLGLPACGSGRGTAPSDPAQSPPANAAQPTGTAAADPTRAPGAGSGPDAARAECEFRVGETCFASDTDACAAAGCKPGSCIVLESYPAQVTCK
jgi:hypothetical protein